ncbi:MAG TPA: response regulator transcription factor [Chloroflexia bacterium]|nr:response regulator transcription factor [Chloroflexia bacterium]
MIRILIVDDHTILRAGIRALLHLHSDLEVVGEAASAEDGIACARAHHPDITLMDIGLPGMDGLTATKELLAACPSTRVIMLTQHENREYVLPALRVGASGYVLKRAPDDTLIRAIRTVYSGGTYLDQDLSDVLVEDVRRQAAGAAGDPYDTLSEREREVLVLLAKGSTYQEVADTLFISAKTVDFHRANVMRKLGLGSRADLTRYALQHRLIS